MEWLLGFGCCCWKITANWIQLWKIVTTPPQPPPRRVVVSSSSSTSTTDDCKSLQVSLLLHLTRRSPMIAYKYGDWTELLVNRVHNLTGPNAAPLPHILDGWLVQCSGQGRGNLLWLACRTTIGECVFIVMQKWPEEEEEGGIKQSQKLYWNYVAVIDRISPRKVSPRVALLVGGGEVWREAYGYRVEIGLWSSEIAVIWRQAGRQLWSGSISPSSAAAAVPLCVSSADSGQKGSSDPEREWMGIYGPVMMTRRCGLVQQSEFTMPAESKGRGPLIGEYWKSNWTTNFRAGHWGLMRGTYN